MLVLYRYRSDEKRTVGLFLLDGKHIADSLELPWRDNAKGRSCIPDGLYRIRWAENGHKWACFEVREVDGKEVQGREGILIHPANSVDELEGCIAPGLKFGDSLSSSNSHLHKLYDAVGDTMSMIVTSKFGG